jgi:hypothetical protein
MGARFRTKSYLMETLLLYKNFPVVAYIVKGTSGEKEEYVLGEIISDMVPAQLARFYCPYIPPPLLNICRPLIYFYIKP